MLRFEQDDIKRIAWLFELLVRDVLLLIELLVFDGQIDVMFLFSQRYCDNFVDQIHPVINYVSLWFLFYRLEVKFLLAVRYSKYKVTSLRNYLYFFSIEIKKFDNFSFWPGNYEFAVFDLNIVAFSLYGLDDTDARHEKKPSYSR
jgi:hypothetical protein